jgi:hypothetical protein
VIEIDDNNGKNEFKVTGVVDESLGKSHIHANMFITMNSGAWVSLFGKTRCGQGIISPILI